ncbi:MAG: Rubrerythrin [uncultured bacterium]|nr:MAG: Rubrerythrin [uncultured bacterium]
MSKTQENLEDAFVGESQANRKYLAFAKAAEKEGKNNLAKLFRAVAEGETVHALKHLTVLGEVKDSLENLHSAIAGETFEIESMYPEFIEAAVEEGEKQAEMSFSAAMKVEQVHQKKFTEALAQVEENGDIAEVKYYVCQVCGNLEIGEAPEHCPICNTLKTNFTLMA